MAFWVDCSQVNIWIEVKQASVAPRVYAGQLQSTQQRRLVRGGMSECVCVSASVHGSVGVSASASVPLPM